MKHSFAQQTCIKKAGLLLQRTAAIWPRCRVGVAISGGVDSLVLLETMLARQKILPFAMEIMALHVNPGFEPQSHAPLGRWLARRGVAAHLELADFGPLAHSDQNKKRSACFFCAMRRRQVLFELCRRYRLSHLALGHNADDLLATFLLNFCRTARVEGMSCKADFFGGKLMVIRPLLLVEKKYIRQAARQWQLPVQANPCPSAGGTARGEADALANVLAAHIPGARRSMLNALMRWQLDRDSRPQAGSPSPAS